MTRRSKTIRIGLSLVMGVVTTVLVAWALALWVPWDDPRNGAAMFSPKGSEISSVSVTQFWQPGALYRGVFVDNEHLVRGSRDALSVPWSARPLEVLSLDHVDRGWGAARRALVLGEGPMATIEIAHGWPCLCLYHWRDWHNGLSPRSGGGLFRMKGEDIWGSDAKVFPTLPIWRGFAINSGLYAVLWLIPLFVPSLIIARVRRWRGRCPRCGYDLAGSGDGCSECGWNRS